MVFQPCARVELFDSAVGGAEAPPIYSSLVWRLNVGANAGFLLVALVFDSVALMIRQSFRMVSFL